MIIKELYLKDFNFLKFSNISSIDIKPSSMEIIVGSNGSGKTKLMNMYSPLPPVSTMFNTNGQKRLSLIHNDDIYELYYNSTDKKHSFKVNGTELNESGTSQVFEELVVNHFQYTKLIDKLIFNKIKLTQMTPSARMEFLINSNPINIKFIKDKYIKIVSQLKKYKHQLEMTNKKLSEYTTNMMKDEEYKKYLHDKQELKQIDNTILKFICKYETLKSLLPSEYKLNKNISEYNQLLRNLIHFRSRHTSNISNIELSDTLYTDIKIQRAALDHKYNDILLKMDQFTTETVELETMLKSSTETNLQQLESQLLDLQKSSEKFYQDDYYKQFIIIDWPPKENQDIKFEALHNLHDLSVTLSDFYNKPIWKDKKYQFHKNRFFQLIRRRDNHVNNLSNLQTQLLSLDNNFNKVTKIYPSKECVIPNCLMKMKYNEIVSLEQDKKKNILKEIEKEDKQYKKILTIIKIYEEFFKYQNNFHNSILKQIQDLITTIDPELMRLFPYGIDSIVDTLNSSLNNVFLKVKKQLDMSNDFWEKRYLLDKIKDIQNTIKSRKSNMSVAFIEKKIKENYENINTLDKELKHISKSLKEYDIQLNYIKLKNGVIKQTADIIRQLEEDISSLENQARYTAYNNTIHDLELVHAHISDFLRDMDRVVLEQNRYRTLFNESDKIRIELEKNINELAILEKALNPYTGLPSVYTKQYLEKILTNVNYFISQVFTYKLSISLIEDKKDKKYKFDVKVDDISVGDISNCSDGQMEIIDLSFTLSLMIALGIHKTHPLFLDEVGRCLDHTHLQKLLEMLKASMDKGYITQMFIINHHAVLVDGFENADIVCLHPDNVILPEKYISNVEIQ